MTPDQHKTLVTTILEAAFNRGEFDVLDTGFNPDVALHDPGLEMRGLQELRGGLERLRTAFPDFHVSIEDQVADDGRVAVRYVGQGTHRLEGVGRVHVRAERGVARAPHHQVAVELAVAHRAAREERLHLVL